ncbi:hypothetical protein [Microbacterium sp. MYb66]|jgi:hypothetical protein|uniref:hypothetical protein n=1 Tax=Microbacterium sp. MYb66 TaxID=1848692 RepID=UPI000CFF51C8|nr:hypothetical protein [Microbacterium sp. MYb66]PRA78851.1 hypothetical protein CQ045_17440 [Microbacterium sp. MYb66]
MDRLLVLTAQVAIAHGHRVEVTEQVDPFTAEPVVLALVDLDTGVRYRRPEEPSGDVARWIGRVLECTVTIGGPAARTALLVDPIGPGATGAKIALRGADAAADAAKAEADRWGGADRPPAEDSERFW